MGGGGDAEGELGLEGAGGKHFDGDVVLMLVSLILCVDKGDEVKNLDADNDGCLDCGGGPLINKRRLKSEREDCGLEAVDKCKDDKNRLDQPGVAKDRKTDEEWGERVQIQLTLEAGDLSVYIPAVQYGKGNN